MKAARGLALYVLSVACASATVACAGIFGFKHLKEAAADGGELASAACRGFVPPDAGDASSGAFIANVSEAPLYFALRSFHYDRDPERPGFNLDGTCTVSPNTNACISHASDDFSQFGIDGDGGVDNAFASLPQRLAKQFFDVPDAAPEFSADALNERIANGRFGAVFKLQDWNGTSEDPQVNVAFFPALGVWQVLDASYLRSGEPQDGGVFYSYDALGDSGLNAWPGEAAATGRVDNTNGGVFIPGGVWDGGLLVPGGPPEPTGHPKFERSDLWMRDERFAVSATPNEAYVTGGLLVAKFEGLVLPLRIGPDRKMFDMELENVSIVAALQPDAPRGLALSRGVLAGIWRASKLVDQVRLLFAPIGAGNGSFLCDIPNFDKFHDVICRRSEVNPDPRKPSDPPLDCNALSVGMGFDTYPINEPGPFYRDDRQFHAASAPGTPETVRAADRCLNSAVPAGQPCTF